MKFLSVTFFAIFTFVPVTYSNNAEVPSWKPIESQNTYLSSNIQNAYQSNGPVLPVKAPVNIPAANPTSRNNDMYKTQPSPIQYANQIGPSIPYQVPQNDPVTQSTVQQTNLQRDRKASMLPLPAKPLHYLPPNLNLKAIYEAAKPTKQYTIVHLNGTVEQTDDLQAIAARHPNFVMLKAADVLANKYSPVQNIGLPQKIPPVQTTPIPVQKPAANVQQATAANQNYQWTSYQGVHNNQQPIQNPQGASLVSNPSPIYQSISNVKSQQPAVGATLVPISAPPSFQQPIPLIKQQIQRYPTDTYTGGSNSQSTIQNSNVSVLPTTPNTVSPQTVSHIQNYNQRSLYTSIIPFNSQNGNQKNFYNQNPNSQVASQKAIEDLHKNAVASNPSAFYPPVNQKNTPNIPSSVSFGSTNIPQGKYNNPPSTKTLHENAVAASPLPIYPETFVPNVAKRSRISNEPLAIGAAVAQPASVPVQQPLTLPNNNQNIILKPQIITDKNEAIKTLTSNFSIPYTDVHNRSSTINLPVSTNPIAQTSSSKDEQPTLPILLPKKQPQENQPPTITQEEHQIVQTPDKSTVNEINLPYNIISIQNKTAEPITKITASEGSAVFIPISNNTVDSSPRNSSAKITTNAQPIDKTNVTNTKSPEIEPINKPKIETDKPNSTTQSVSNDPSTISNTEKPWSLLTLSDDSIWNLIRNNTQNVYFFFMPPRPKVTKESKTIIYANGTTVEEITETVVDVDSDGEPKMTITTTKSYS